MKKLLILALSFLFLQQANTQDWFETTKVVASDREVEDQFGRTVSISGNYAIVGAALNDVTVSGGFQLENAGAAYVYERDEEGVWHQLQKLEASDHEKHDRFGYSVSISNNYIIVGATTDDDDVAGGNSLDYAGSAYIFEKDEEGIWNEVQKIVASDRRAFDRFGNASAISGNFAVVGAFINSTNANGDNFIMAAGAAYIFERDISGNWNEVNKIVASDRGQDDYFGWTVAVNGNNIIVGANQESEDANGEYTMNEAGSAYIFERDEAEGWSQVQKIVHSDRDFSDNFGHSVSISGNIAVVGAIDKFITIENEEKIYNAGAVYVFERNESNNWEETQKLMANDFDKYDWFGSSVSLSGNYLLVGAFGENDIENSLNRIGSAYLFERNMAGEWNQVQKVIASDRADEDHFGTTVSISDGYCIIGAYMEDEDVDGENTMNEAGSAYFFKNGSIGIIEKTIGKLPIVYPNPTTNEINIDLGYEFQQLDLTVRNIYGLQIQNETFVSNRLITFHLDGTPGLYFIEIQSDQAKFPVLKVLKR